MLLPVCVWQLESAALSDARNQSLPVSMNKAGLEIAEKTARITSRDKKLKELAAHSDTARRLQTLPGVGPSTALSIEAFAPDMSRFRRGRDFAAWLGLVPRQHSSGGPLAPM